ncbi:MAG: hypothetical protein K8R54_18050 [Bacteroidales bacterium]|nr:hypothetical protein [Bacteroidales bacterium]
MKNFFKNNINLFLIAFIFAFVINLPDLYPILINLEAWVPVNSPPYSIGDDYFYFGILNKMSQVGISLPQDHYNGSNLLSHEFVRILAYLINLPFYKIGCLILDQRLGIFFVRFFNAFFLYLSIIYFLNKLSSLLKTVQSKVYIHFMAVVFFFFFTKLYPPYSHIFNLRAWFSPSYIFYHGQFNDLSRAIISGTSGTAILFAIGYIIFIFQNYEKTDKHFYIPLLLFTILAFIHVPSAIILIFISGLIILFRYKLLVFIKHKYKVLLMIFVFGGIILFQKIVLASSEMGKELFDTTIDLSLIMPNESSSLIRIKRIAILAIFPYFLPIVSFYFFRKKMPKYVFIIFFALTIFSISTIFQSTHYSRFWYRGAIIPYIVFSVFFVVQILIKISQKFASNKVIKTITIVMLFIVWGVMTGFFYLNAKYLTKNYFRSTNMPELSQYIISDNDNNNLLLTNSGNVIYFVNCYSHHRLVFQDYSFQPHGYKKNLTRVMENFALLGVSKERFIELFKKHSYESVSDWGAGRPYTNKDVELFTKSYIYSLYFLSTYYTYNEMLQDDIIKLKKKGNTSGLFIKFIKQNYPENKIENYRNVKFDIILETSGLEILPVDIVEKLILSDKLTLDKGKIIIFKDVIF